MKSRIDNRGFSISELLMVVLIIGLIAVVVGGGLTVVKNSYDRITLKAEAQTLLSTSISKVTDEFRFAREVEKEEDGSVTFLSGNYNFRISFVNGSGDKEGIMINGAATGENAPLLTDKAMTSGLTTSITYDYADNLFTATVSVLHGGSKIAEQTIKVAPVNS